MSTGKFIRHAHLRNRITRELVIALFTNNHAYSSSTLSEIPVTDRHDLCRSLQVRDSSGPFGIGQKNAGSV